MRFDYDGATIKRLREEAGFGRTFLARCAGVSVGTIRNLETNAAAKTSGHVLEAIGRVLAVHPSVLAPDYRAPLPEDIGQVRIDVDTLDRLRRERGLSTLALANRARIDEGTIRGYRTGRLRTASVDIVLKLARALTVRPGMLAPMLDVVPAVGERDAFEAHGHPLRYPVEFNA